MKKALRGDSNIARWL